VFLVAVAIADVVFFIKGKQTFLSIYLICENEKAKDIE